MNKEPRAFDAKDSEPENNKFSKTRKAVAGAALTVLFATGIAHQTNALEKLSSAPTTQVDVETLTSYEEANPELSFATAESINHDQEIIEAGTELPETVTLHDFYVENSIISDAIDAAEKVNGSPLSHRQKAGVTVSGNNLTHRLQEAGESGVVAAGTPLTIAQIEQYTEGDTESTYIVLKHIEVNE